MKTLLLKCVDVIDHGHCSTSRWSSEDERAVLSLYVLKEDGTPVAGELLQMRPHDEKRLATESELWADLQAFGVSFATRAADGSIERVHPMDVMLRSPAPAPEPIPTLYPADHMDGAIADPFPPLLRAEQMPPPVANEHVAEGCEQFTESQPEPPVLEEHPSETTEAITSLDTPAQILGAGAEEPHSD